MSVRLYFYVMKANIKMPALMRSTVRQIQIAAGAGRGGGTFRDFRSNAACMHTGRAVSGQVCVAFWFYVRWRCDCWLSVCCLFKPIIRHAWMDISHSLKSTDSQCRRNKRTNKTMLLLRRRRLLLRAWREWNKTVQRNNESRTFKLITSWIAIQ